ncbi:RNase3 domain-containing protein [Paraphaeosphaeria sporulosa]
MSSYGAQKRGGGFDHYSNGNSQKYARPDNSNFHPRNPNFNAHQPRNHNYPTSQSGPPTSKERRGETAHLDYIDRLPDSSKCEPCKLAKEEADAGIIGLLAKVEADEQMPEGDKDILRCAGELRRLLSARNDKKHAKQMKQLDKARPFEGKYVMIPGYIEQQIEKAKSLPSLPPIEPSLEVQVFTHASVYESKAKAKGLTSTDDLTYERLEFIGDAYLEVIATRLIAHRLPHLDVPSQAHFREQLVRNDTLAKFSNDYGLVDRMKHASHLKPGTASKVWTKITADVFEAYVAAVVLSDPVEGFLTAEKWMNQLWAEQVLEYRAPILVENVNAQEELHRLIQMNHIKVTYMEEKQMEMTATGVQQYYQGVYLTGWGYENEWLGSGVGRNKSQAAVNAAQDALTRNNNALQTATSKKKEFLAHQQIERDQKRADLRRQAAAGDEEAIAELRRIISNDIRIKTKLAGKGDEAAAATLKELIAEEAALPKEVDSKDGDGGNAQSQISGRADETKGYTQFQNTANGNPNTTPSKKTKKNKDAIREGSKTTKDTKQSSEDFLANIMAGGNTELTAAKDTRKDGSSWLEKEQKKKEKEERKKQEKMAKKDKRANAA